MSLVLWKFLWAADESDQTVLFELSSWQLLGTKLWYPFKMPFWKILPLDFHIRNVKKNSHWKLLPHIEILMNQKIFTSKPGRLWKIDRIPQAQISVNYEIFSKHLKLHNWLKECASTKKNSGLHALFYPMKLKENRLHHS